MEYTHYGEMYKGVEMRGEVGLLTRNIKFDSEDAANSTTYGGHIKVRKRMGSYQGSYTSKMDLVFGHPVTSDKNVWSQSISANENKT